MMMAQRFPTYFDGIVAMCPVMDLPKIGVWVWTWAIQAFAEAARSERGKDAMVGAAKVLAATAIDFLSDPALLARAKAAFAGEA